MVRRDMPDRIYKTEDGKFRAVAREVAQLHAKGQPVLIGTVSIAKNELLSQYLTQLKVPHTVLNAKNNEAEAAIIAAAGRRGAVTLATNIAGRGTDIVLEEGVDKLGGLHVLGTERHESRRIDNQLRGRAGRQGDPGSSQFYVSLEDDLMRLFGSERIAKMMDRMGLQEGEVIQHSMITNSIERAQRKVEENNFGVRKRLIEYDDVMNSQREVIYKRRRHALFGERLAVDIANMIYDTTAIVVSESNEVKDYANFQLELIKLFSMECPVTEQDFFKLKTEEISDIVYQAAVKAYVHK